MFKDMPAWLEYELFEFIENSSFKNIPVAKLVALQSFRRCYEVLKDRYAIDMQETESNPLSFKNIEIAPIEKEILAFGVFTNSKTGISYESYTKGFFNSNREFICDIRKNYIFTPKLWIEDI